MFKKKSVVKIIARRANDYLNNEIHYQCIKISVFCVSLQLNVLWSASKWKQENALNPFNWFYQVTVNVWRLFFCVSVFLDVISALLQQEPYTMPKGSELEGYCMDLLSELSKKLSFKYNVHLVKDGSYGRQDERGNWNGMIGEVLRGVSARRGGCLSSMLNSDRFPAHLRNCSPEWCQLHIEFMKYIQANQWYFSGDSPFYLHSNVLRADREKIGSDG